MFELNLLLHTVALKDHFLPGFGDTNVDINDVRNGTIPGDKYYGDKKLTSAIMADKFSMKKRPVNIKPI